MKNIFKKLHIGSNHDPNRSNDTLSPPSASDHRQNSTVSPASPSTSSPLSAVVPATPAGSRQDYYSSEEEYQLQLALALSVSGRDSGNEVDKEQVNAAARLSLGGNRSDDSARERSVAAAELQSRQYWDYGVLDYEEKVVDGFYDVYGLATDSSNQGKMPSITEIETNPDTSGFEVVIVNRTIDPVLEELVQIAHCFALDCPAAEVRLLVQRLAELVTEHMGGAVRDANIILARWIERSTKLRTSLHTGVLPVGSLKIGLSRHRALLFKVLADNVGITCRLVKGSHYTGVEDDAVNIIKLANESEFLVDLMGAPGTLLPVDIFSTKDASFKSPNTKLCKLPSLQTTNDSGAVNSRQTLRGEFGSLNATENNLLLDRKSGSEKKESIPSVQRVDGDIGAGSSGFTKRGISNNQLDHVPSLTIGSSLYKGGRGLKAVGDGLRMNVNVIPYTQNGAEDAKNLFADLNPFQIKGSGKGSIRNNPPENKVDDFQRLKNNIASDRPAVPLKWKNTYAYNEDSRLKKHDFVEEGLFPKNNSEATVYKMSLASNSSSPQGNVQSDNLIRADLVSAHVDYGERDWSAGSNSPISLAEIQFSGLSLESSVIPNYNEQYHRAGEDRQSEELDIAKEHLEIVISQNDERLATYNLNLKNGAMPSSTVDYTRSKVGPEVYDVGECEIPWEDLVLGERIGIGSYGEVYHADWNGIEVAVKKFLDQDFSGAALAEFKREVRIMRGLRHPNVVLFMGAVTRPPNLSIITEYLPRGSLYRIIHRPHSQIDEKSRIKMALDVAKGMTCLHASMPTIVHRDLKSPNLLVDKNWNVKVGDFGLSRLKHNTFLSSKSTAGTPEWMAPEVLRNENSNEKCDVYSFGVILWELATLKLPWKGMNPMQVVGAVGFQNRRLEIPNNVDPLVARIIWECWQNDPNLRPSFAQLTVALKPLQRLSMPPYTDQPTSPLPQEILMNSTP